jgi:hypothetical protein
MIIEAGTPEGNNVKKVFVNGQLYEDVVYVDTNLGICRYIPRDERGQLKFDLAEDKFIEEEVHGKITLEMDDENAEQV